MKKNKGFSLIELLVVISIIGVLTTVLVMNFVGSRERARDAQMIQSMNSLKNALRMYYNDNQTYPENILDLPVLVEGDYIKDLSFFGDQIPTYVPTPDGEGFYLFINLEVGAGDEDIQSQINCGIQPEMRVDKVYMICAS